MKRTDRSLDWVHHVDFVRNLAARLAADGHDADDVAQETFLRAIECPPESRENVRGWLARVLVNFLRQERRRRRIREADLTRRRPKVSPSSSDIAEQIDLNCRVSQAVFELKDPYRSALHQRYYCGFSAAEIAAREGIPIETVRSRIKRALAMIRGRLDREFHGDRNRWCTVLLPLTPAPKADGLGVLFGVAMGLPTKVSASIALLALLVGLLFCIQSRTASNPGASSWAHDSPLASAPSSSSTFGELQEAADEKPIVTTPMETEVEVSDLVPTIGTLILLDGRAEHYDATGYFDLISERPEEDPTVTRVEVEDGEFAVDIDPFARLSTGTMTFNGSPASMDRKPDMEGDRVVFYARIGAPSQKDRRHPPGPGSGILLHIVDAATKRPLFGVTVLQRTEEWRENEHPGDLESFAEIAKDASSPIEVSGNGVAILCVHAPGLSWKRIKVDFSSGGERTIELTEGGSLRVTTQGDATPDFAWVRLRRPERIVYQYVVEKKLVANGATVIEDLRPGTYEILIQTGREDGVCTYGRSEVEINAGHQKAISIEINRSLVPDRVPLRGKLLFENEDLPMPFTLRLKRDRDYTESLGQEEIVFASDDLEATPRRKEERRWDAGFVMPGSYSAIIPEIRFGTRFVVPSNEGNRDVTFRVPTPFEVVLTCRNADDGRRIEPEWIGTSAGRLGGATENRNFVRAERIREDGTVLLWVVPGEIGVTAHAKGYQAANRAPVLVRAGDREIGFRLVPSLSLKIRLEHAGSTVPADYRFWRRVEIDPPTGIARDSVVNAGRKGGFYQLFYVSTPGFYRIAFPRLRGYREIPPQSLEIRGRGITEVVIPIEPADD